MKISNLKVNGINEPLGYQFDYLTFSWDLEAATVPDTLSFSVDVSEDADFQNILWQGETDSSFNNLSTEAEFLKPRSRYFWRVSAGNSSARSWFETAKMDEEWQADWISYEEESLASVSFSKVLHFSKAIKSARLYTLALGLYELEINGEKVGHEYLTPGYHSYDLMQQYQTYDVADYLETDTDLTFLVGDGWYRGRFVFEGGFENIYGDKQKLIAELHIAYEDGSDDVIVTDGTWLTRSNHTQENAIYDGETIDYAAKIQKLTTVVEEAGKELLTARLDLPVEVAETLKARAFFDSKGDLILDFGQEITGWISGPLPADKSNVSFQFAEVLQDGAFYIDNLRTAKQEFIIRNNKEERQIRPHFTFFGFRYVKVTGLSEEEALKFTAQALQSKMDGTFTFNSSHAKLNQLLSNIRWSQRDNFLSIPTDCPQRDERMGWTGDITVFANTASYNMETRAFLGHFMKNLRLEQKELKGAVPFFAPYPKIAPQEGLNPFLTSAGAAVWGDAGTVLPYTLYKHFRDKGLLAQHIDAMTDWVDYIYEQDQARGGRRLWDFGWQLGDWLALDSGIAGSVFGATDSSLIASVYYYISATYTAQALAVLGDSRASFYHELSNQVKQAILETYFIEDELNLTPVTLQSEVELMRQQMAQSYGGVQIPTAIDTQTGLALLLRYGLYPSQRAQEALSQKLQEKMAEHDGFLTTGFAGTPALPHALLENGLRTEAFELLFKEAAPSWLFEVNMGATTTWERWDSILPDGSISGTGMNSLNHYAYGSVQDFVVEKILGINLPEVDDVTDTYKIQPHYTKQLDWIKGGLKTPNGNLNVSWKIEGDIVTVTIDLPVRTKAHFVLSDGSIRDLEAGQSQIQDKVV